MTPPRQPAALLMGAGLLLAAGPASADPGSYDSHGKRDPFIPLVHDGRFVAVTGGMSTAASVSDLHLAGIVWDAAGSSIALINETEVKVGDQIGEYQVAEIRQDAVVLLKDGKPIMLQLTFDTPTPSQEQRGGEDQ